jgi:small-conductance mechanosensitive channel
MSELEELLSQLFGPSPVARWILFTIVFLRVGAKIFVWIKPRHQKIHHAEKTLSWLVWLLVFLWIIYLAQPLLIELERIQIHFGKLRIDMRTIIEALIASGLVMGLSLWLASAIETRLLARVFDDLSIRQVAANVLRTALLAMGFFISLSLVGVDQTALSVLGGALGVGLGLGLQKLAANYVSGFVILLERSVRIGDHVKVDHFEGRVTDIKTRFTVIRDAGGKESIVPNEFLLTNRIENFTLHSSNVVINAKYMVSHQQDAHRVQALLINAALSVDDVLKTPLPAAHLTQVALEGLEFQLSFWTDEPERGNTTLRSKVNLAVLDALRLAKIPLAVHHRDIQMGS